ncbi:flagellar basal body FlgE domain-containing protein, partial [Enterobacter cloacae]|uniref:flagellar basal body FlgE domain-containing protein n=1 Tax=Enterobacter cloacae TaxID=550 RepID=UPI0023EEF32D
GNKHAIKVYFVHTGEGKWQAHAEDSTSPDGIKDIELNFDTSGNIVGHAELDIQGKSYNGSAALAVKLDLSKLSQNSGDMQIMLGEIDGQAPGKFNGYEVSDSGEVIVIYSNQKRQTVA